VIRFKKYWKYDREYKMETNQILLKILMVLVLKKWDQTVVVASVQCTCNWNVLHCFWPNNESEESFCIYDTMISHVPISSMLWSVWRGVITSSIIRRSVKMSHHQLILQDKFWWCVITSSWFTGSCHEAVNGCQA